MGVIISRYFIASEALAGDFSIVKKRISPIALVLVGSLFVITAFGQQPSASSRGVTPTETRTSASGSKTGKDVSTDQIEQDISEALTVIENNYVGGKKLD